ncbi:Ceramide glucosyltransferase [Ceraceosorus bombacis]|uniref:Ceramide glucosyltransferase n=1 Tax=Ceraceosorus bombacis TaxID=401625 RepID=A0A0P1BAM4_9BASI|nr:Ceramide glucosyltransferase [Ceraceosorus bombacis]
MSLLSLIHERLASRGPSLVQDTATAAAWSLLDYVAAVGLGWYVVIWSISILGLRIAKRLYTPPIPTSPLSSLRADQRMPSSGVQSAAPAAPGVSILRPLAGLDHNLWSNLASSFEQRYAKDSFEIILSVKDEQDQALEVARDVVARYPQVQSRIVIGDEEAGVNPKINNLVIPYSLARFDIIWVLDSQCCLSTTALGRAVDALTHSPPPVPSPRFLRRLSIFGGSAYARTSGSNAKVGLVHHVPLATSASNNWGSQVEQAFLSTNHAKMYLALNALAIDSCVMGKSNLYRKSDLQRVQDDFFGVDEGGTGGESGAIGSSAFDADAVRHAASSSGSSTANNDSGPAGSQEIGPNALVSKTTSRALARFSIFLAEDNMLALSLWRPPLSLHHVVSPGDAVCTSVGGMNSLWTYASRRMRWIRVRKRMVLAATIVEPFTESIVAGLVALFSLRRLLRASSHLSADRTEENYLNATNVWSVVIFLTHELAWHTIDAAVMKSLRGGENLPPDQMPRFRMAWIIRECLALPIWIWAMCGSTVTWRDQRFRILPNGRAAHAAASPTPFSFAAPWLGLTRHSKKNYSRLDND